jgi:phosphatidylethanolamine/phosphatidyl-N-methylethanolamine N-methyltransferase
MSLQNTLSLARKNLRIDDEVRFIRSWIEKPLSTGAVTPSGKVLARTMASYVDTDAPGPVIELGPGTGPVTEALVAHGVDPPQATVVQGDAYRLKHLLGTLAREPAAAIVSGLPLLTKPLRTRLRLIWDAFALLSPGAPFIQFTYAVMPPIPRRLTGVDAAPSEVIWLNLPPARVWVYRKS